MSDRGGEGIVQQGCWMCLAERSGSETGSQEEPTVLLIKGRWSRAEMNGVIPPLCWWVCEITAVLQSFPVIETWHSFVIRPQVWRDVYLSRLMSLFWWLATWHDSINQLRLDLDLGVKDLRLDMRHCDSNDLSVFKLDWFIAWLSVFTL